MIPRFLIAAKHYVPDVFKCRLQFKTNTLDLLAMLPVGPTFTRPAYHMQPTMCVSGQTDQRTDGHCVILIRNKTVKNNPKPFNFEYGVNIANV